MGCVHTHQGILALKGWGNPNCTLNVVIKIWGRSSKGWED